VQLFKLRNTHGCLSGGAGAAWPYRLVSAIFKSLLDQHASRFSIEAFTPALEITRDEQMNRYLVRTPRGIIRARHVVHCTEAHTSHLLPRLRGIIWPRRGQMSVHSPGTVLASQGGKYSWAFRFASYFDYVTQNAKTGEVFIGGGEVNLEDAPWDVYANPSDAEELLQNKIHLNGVLPQVFDDPTRPEDASSRMKASWTGVMGFSIDGYPLVGHLPDTVTGRTGSASGGEWIAAGFGGYGMVNSFLSGRAVAEQLLGQKAALLPRSHVFDEERHARSVTELERRLQASLHSKPEFKALL
jgi:glycine/D-amino acid oxidase-like deaminating enzyme